MTRRDGIPATALDKIMSHGLSVHDGQCRCVILLDGRLDAARLARAVELSLDAAPVLGCRYSIRPWSSRWERCPLPYPTAPFGSVETRDPQGAVERFLAESMDPMRGPQAAVRLIRPERDTVCVKLDHMAADATGLLDYARLLCGLYRRLRTDPDHIPPAESAKDRYLRRVLRGAGPAAVARGFLHFRYPRSSWGFPGAGSAVLGRTFPIRRIGPERVARIRACGRAGQARFSDVFLTAFFRTLIALLDPPAGARLPVELTVDLRRYLPSGRANAICDLAGACFPAIRHRPGTSFDETLADVRTAVAGAQSGRPWLGTASVLGLLSLFPTGLQTRCAQSVVKRAGRGGTAYPIFSNLGIIDPGLFDFGDAEAAGLDLFGPVMFPPNFEVCVYSFRDRLSITAGLCRTAADRGLADAFFDRFLDELPG